MVTPDTGSGDQSAWKTVTQAAVYLGVSERTIRRYLRSGKLGKVEVGGRTMIQPADLDRLASIANTARPHPATLGHSEPARGGHESPFDRQHDGSSIFEKLQEQYEARIAHLEAENSRLWESLRPMLPAPRRGAGPVTAWYWTLAAAIVAAAASVGGYWLWMNW